MFFLMNVLWMLFLCYLVWCDCFGCCASCCKLKMYIWKTFSYLKTISRTSKITNPQKEIFLSLEHTRFVFEFFVRLFCNLRSKTFAFRLSQVDLNLDSTSRWWRKYFCLELRIRNTNHCYKTFYRWPSRSTNIHAPRTSQKSPRARSCR